MTIHTPQVFRRYSAVFLCALASLLLGACGGGGESGADDSRLDSAAPSSEGASTGVGADNNETEPSASDDVDGQTDTDTAGEDVPQESVAEVEGRITLEWHRPQYRENGDLIRDGEIGGYEVRYRQIGADQAESIVIDGEWALEYELEGLDQGDYEFSVAAYDTNGLYSEFVSISPL